MRFRYHIYEKLSRRGTTVGGCSSPKVLNYFPLRRERNELFAAVARHERETLLSLSFARILQRKATKRSGNDRACQPGYYERVSINPRLELKKKKKEKTQRCKTNVIPDDGTYRRKRSLIETVNVTETATIHLLILSSSSSLPLLASYRVYTSFLDL